MAHGDESESVIVRHINMQLEVRFLKGMSQSQYYGTAFEPKVSSEMFLC